jgi:very-short-patch-repair endonuclease
MTTLRYDKGWRPEAPPLQGRGLGWGLSVEQLRELHRRAAEMRRNPTEPEKRLWRHLSNGQLLGAKFRRQSVIGRFIADFLCPQKALIVEVDGDTHDEAKDRLRDDILASRGFRVVRVTNDDVMRNMDGVLQHILMALNAAPDRWNKPHPNPSPEGEGLEKTQLHPSPSGEGRGVGAVIEHKPQGSSLEGSVE